MAGMRVRSRHLLLGLALCLITLVCLLLSNPSPSERPSEQIREDIFKLSENYLKAIAREQKNLDDGPYVGTNTAYDLKKTLAVLLESILARLDRLEKRVMGTTAAPDNQQKEDAIVKARDLLHGKQENCEMPSDYKTHFPDCEPKIKWMETFWKSDPCYAENGVDGSFCSIVIYLGEIETHCPRLSWRPTVETSWVERRIAIPNTDLNALFSLMTDNPTNFQWIKGRIERMWPKWVAAYDFLAQRQNWTLKARRKKNVLLHLGLLTKESGFKFGEKSLKGGPLGELVQWADLVAVLHLLGHNLVISSELRTFLGAAQRDPALKSSCPVLGSEHVDLIYTDIVGLRQMKRKIPGSLQNYKCRLRVLDSFGTEAPFNDPTYFASHKSELGGKPKNIWGSHKLNLQQFYNMYPHTADNSFLGFVVEMHSNGSEQLDQAVSWQAETRHNWSLVYGKESYMWKGSETYLSLVNDLVQVHATVSVGKEPIPGFVVNHGVLDGEQFHRLLRQVKIFLGLGFPYEGPAPLEALANGAVYINPRFKVAKSRATEPFFAEKPTLRALTSQNPYAEEFIGRPYVLTIDINNKEEVVWAVNEAVKTTLVPYLPYEFTAPGMLERVNALVEHQDFCSESSNWPPFSAAHIILSDLNQSCQKACRTQGYVCEPSYFVKINTDAVLNKYGQCETSRSDADLSAPMSSATGECVLQSNPLLLSCSGSSSNHRRLCPCRDYIRGQVALCAACL